MLKKQRFRSRCNLITIANDKYKIIKKINEGSCGSIYLGKNIQSQETVAIKIEKQNPKARTYLENEYNVYQTVSGIEGFPKIFHYCEDSKRGKVLIMEVLGPSLEEMYRFCKKRLTIDATLSFAIQMINRLQVLHSKGYVHCDIKPSNFLTLPNNNGKFLYLADFGLSKLYRDPETNQHVEFNGNKRFCGTIVFSSIKAFAEGKQSRRDDMEAIVYTIIYLCKGSLPWQNVHSQHKRQRDEAITEMKTSLAIHQLCEGLPAEVSVFLQHCRNLEYTEEPSYKYYEGLLFAAIPYKDNSDLSYPSLHRSLCDSSRSVSMELISQ
ncbi:casein kinase I-like [Teleopsis dalmanni]|uniref:casein kinase I-like n=1 Tax=Teleopsis dalmanni TaxID=139649 RepID=UPI0018CE093B|nr:casein kinase I-like [Teleopsis dalmanni]